VPARRLRRQAKRSTPAHALTGRYQVVYPGPAVFAYLDPGTGSMLVQILVGGVAAAAVAAKLYWYRILRLLRIRKDAPEPERER
jgi:hypothetical protein